MSWIGQAKRVQDGEREGNVQFLSFNGLDEFSPDALPFYTAWIRQDMVLLASFMVSLLKLVRLAVVLLAVIAICLVYFLLR